MTLQELEAKYAELGAEIERLKAPMFEMVKIPGKNIRMGKFPVTQREWVEIMGENPSYFKGDFHPVEQVSWEDIVYEFIQRLNAKTGRKFRLPTEAEWEYCAKAGGDIEYADNIDEVAWHWGNSDGTTHPVGLKKPNAFGLYDMRGHIWEWCQDEHN
jgi:formylglycine-generating enzyme required for sulfatase activity